MSNWSAGVDAQTLANAAALITRGTTTREKPERWPKATETITVSVGGVIRQRDI